MCVGSRDGVVDTCTESVWSLTVGVWQSATGNIAAQLSQRSDSGEAEGYRANWSYKII